MKQENTGSTVIYILLGILFIAIIGGVSAWFYVNKPAPVSQNSTTTPTAKVDEISAAKTDLKSTLQDVDNDLMTITDDEGASDDTINL